jgi:hypothetical protein
MGKRNDGSSSIRVGGEETIPHGTWPESAWLKVEIREHRL